ncbi:hypothetical protein CVT24_010756, partial [Panaeolus cyanescens]
IHVVGTSLSSPPSQPIAPAPSSADSTQGIPPDQSTTSNGEKEQSRSNRRRANKRRRKMEQNGHASTEWMIREHVQLSEPLILPIDQSQAQVSGSGYVGVTSKESKHALRKEYSLQEFLDKGFEVVKWDGRDARPILDSKGRICGVLAGRPRGPSFDAVLERTCSFLEDENRAEQFQASESKHRRGHFAAIACGLSFGGGQKTAQRLAPGPHGDLIRRFLAHRDIGCIASFADSAFRTWAPRLYNYYRTTLHKASAHAKEPINFPGSCFAAMSVNMGGRVCCFKHRDCVNLAFGWCAITALGDFNPEKGGHFVLWDLKLVIEFPPGSTILIPSAIFSHSNTTLDAGERRFSITQYTAGALFRWVENGFKTDKELQLLDPAHFDHMC